MWEAVMFFFVQYKSVLLFFFKQKTAYEMRISDWSSDVCSSDLPEFGGALLAEPSEGLGEHRVTIDGRPATDWVERAMEELSAMPEEIGRASCRERVCQYV